MFTRTNFLHYRRSDSSIQALEHILEQVIAWLVSGRERETASTRPTRERWRRRAYRAPASWSRSGGAESSSTCSMRATACAAANGAFRRRPLRSPPGADSAGAASRRAGAPAGEERWRRRPHPSSCASAGAAACLSRSARPVVRAEPAFVQLHQ